MDKQRPILPVSKNLMKHIRALEHRKFRRQENLFVAEGNKLLEDNLSTMKCHQIVATDSWWQQHPHASRYADECYVTDADGMRRLSFLQSPQDVLATFRIPNNSLNLSTLRTELTVMLDDVQDPGNVGTIIRLCDWFGIRDIVCSPNTADCYNPKVVQATMGAIARVRVTYTPLADLLNRLPDVPVYGTFLEGDNMYRTSLTPHGIIIMGNEGRGISTELSPFITRKLHIPSFPPEVPTSESLNVGIATAITVAEFRRVQMLSHNANG